MHPRIDGLAARAPDAVAAWRALDDDYEAIRDLARSGSGPGRIPGLVLELAAIADELAAIAAALPEAAFRMPGGEGDWNVAQAIGHTADSRAGLVLAASRAASGRWPAEEPVVTPGVPGPAGATRDELVRRIAVSQRIVVRAAPAIEGHERDDCPLRHDLVGRLTCGEWVLFAGIHDLMHVDQLERLERSMAVPATGGGR
jgi:hypothetical protein